jgi:hypothetical protein
MNTVCTDYEPAPLASMRMTLADGRAFTFAASDDGGGKISFAATDGERMTSEEFATLVMVEHIDSLGRVAQCMRAASSN